MDQIESCLISEISHSWRRPAALLKKSWWLIQAHPWSFLVSNMEVHSIVFFQLTFGSNKAIFPLNCFHDRKLFLLEELEGLKAIIQLHQMCLFSYVFIEEIVYYSIPSLWVLKTLKHTIKKLNQMIKPTNEININEKIFSKTSLRQPQTFS